MDEDALEGVQVRVVRNPVALSATGRFELAEAQVTQRQVEVLQAQQEVALARDEWDRLRSHTGEAEAPVY